MRYIRKPRYLWRVYLGTFLVLDESENDIFMHE